LEYIFESAPLYFLSWLEYIFESAPLYFLSWLEYIFESAPLYFLSWLEYIFESASLYFLSWLEFICFPIIGSAELGGSCCCKLRILSTATIFRSFPRPNDKDFQPYF
jgi:hypothetical protein